MYVDSHARGLVVEVRPAWRDRGLDRALTARAIDACRLRGCQTLDATVRKMEHPSRANVLTEAGFHLESSLTGVTIDMAARRAVLEADMARLHLSAGFTLRDCPAAELAPVCRLWHSSDRDTVTLAHMANLWNQAARALYRDAHPSAFALYSRTSAAPAFRGARGNLAMMASLVRSALDEGMSALRFAWTIGTRHTPGFAKRYAARTDFSQDRYVLPLVP